MWGITTEVVGLRPAQTSVRLVRVQQLVKSSPHVSLGTVCTYQLFKKAMETKTHKERVEEAVEEFAKLRLIDGTEANGILDVPGTVDIRQWLRSTLLTLRREMLEERVKKMEEEQRKYYSTPDDGDDYDRGGWDVLQTLIDADRKELEELTN